jgi:sulfite exporter TauE/SafE
MSAALVLAAGLMGLAGAPHCALMCATPCAGVVRACGGGRGSSIGFQLGRLSGYAMAGAVAASGLGLLQQWMKASPVLQPLWLLLQLAVFALGGWMLLRGTVPALRPFAAAPTPTAPSTGWQRVRGPVRGAAAGVAWAAWPCGLLQSALLVSALAGSAPEGAFAMAAFALASSPGLVAAPLLLRRLALASGRDDAATWPVRLSGLMLAGAALFALTHGLWQHAAGWCVTALS